MVDKIKQTPYSIGYVGISFYADIAKAEIGTAALKSYSGEFLLPTSETIEAASASLGPRTTVDERLTSVNAPGANCYPGETLLAVAAGWHVSARYPLICLLRDALLPVLFFSALRGDDFVWRGNEMQVERPHRAA